MPSTYESARIIRATPKRLFEAWLDRVEHNEMTGRVATIGPDTGEPFSVADGITGRSVEAEPYHRIVQIWSVDAAAGPAFE